MESITQNNPFLTIVLSEFNVRSSKRWTDDETAQKSLKIEDLCLNFLFHK